MQFKDVKQMRKATLRGCFCARHFRSNWNAPLDYLGSSGDLEHYNFLVEQAAELDKQPANPPAFTHGKYLIALASNRQKSWAHCCMKSANCNWRMN